MLLKFHQLSNGKVTAVPLHSIKYIVAHEDGGATICTTIPAPTPDKPKNFRSVETVEEIYRAMTL